MFVLDSRIRLCSYSPVGICLCVNSRPALHTAYTSHLLDLAKMLFPVNFCLYVGRHCIKTMSLLP
jgi:hypothetical protein